LAAAKAKGTRLGRPRVVVDVAKISGAILTAAVMLPLTFSDQDIAGLPDPPAHGYPVGRRNPAFGHRELELQIFESIFRAATTSLCEWKSNAGDRSVGYAVKEITMDSNHICKIGHRLDCTWRDYGCLSNDSSEVRVRPEVVEQIVDG